METSQRKATVEGRLDARRGRSGGPVWRNERICANRGNLVPSVEKQYLLYPVSPEATLSIM